MDKTIRKFTDPSGFEELKAEEYRYWQSRPAQERLDAVEELIQTAYELKKDGRSSLMHPDHKDLLFAFQSHGVKYLIVGGFAVIYHSQPRFTKDMLLPNEEQISREDAKSQRKPFILCAFASLREINRACRSQSW